jgi:predicted dehydrogenase
MGEIDLGITPPTPARTDYGIGAIGAGFIMRDIHLVAYREAGFNTVALASRTPANAREAAAQNGVETVYDTWKELLDDPRVEIVDIAFPPDQQLEIVRAACEKPHVKGILAQKPLAFTLADAIEMERVCRESGKVLGVNQNMRYDQSMRALKTLLEGGHLGTPVMAQIVMNARPHWQDFVRAFDRTAILNMSIHHLDCYRFLFGDPKSVLCSVRPDPSHDFEHSDGMAITILEYEDGLRALASDDCFTWADGRIEWRVEGTEGIAKGRIGWPDYPDGSPSTIDYHLRAEEGVWHQPRWDERWFPQAFIGTMGQLMIALDTGEKPAIDAADNLRTMALIEATYRAAERRCAVEIGEVLSEAGIA